MNRKDTKEVKKKRKQNGSRTEKKKNKEVTEQKQKKKRKMNLERIGREGRIKGTELNIELIYFCVVLLAFQSITVSNAFICESLLLLGGWFYKDCFRLFVYLINA